MTEAEATLSEMGPHDIQWIMDYLPHRFPFLLVDRVVSLTPNKVIDAYKNVSYNEGFFQGHFPGLPVMPGVLIIEALAQAGGLMVLSSFELEEIHRSIFLFSGMEGVKFRKPVLPGDRLDLKCELIRQRMRLWKMKGAAYVNGAVVAEAEMTAAIAARSDF